MPASDAIAKVADGSLAPAPPAGVPGARVAHETKGLDVALRGLTVKKLLDRPLVENLRAKRALKAPWRWLTAIPDAKEEQRIDDRLHKLAEWTRLADLTP